MTRRAREVETLLLTMYAALPLYLTQVIRPLPVMLFHLVMAGIALRVALGRGTELISPRLMRWLAVIYVPFYVVDVAIISRSAIAASTHLVLFIAIYQPIESMQRTNQAQRLLTTTLIFIASLATSTHVTAMLFVLTFAFLMLRQLMYLSHLDTVRAVSREYDAPPSGRSAAYYLVGAALIGAALFPLLPRIKNPFVQGLTSSLPGASSTLGDSIDFREQRVALPDSTLVARVWMGIEARPFFSPVRLRGPIYDRYEEGEWKQAAKGLRERGGRDGTFVVARPRGAEREAVVQLIPQRGMLLLPVGTFLISGLEGKLYEGPAPETWYTYNEALTHFTVRMAYEHEPLRLTRVTPVSYPIRPEIATLAQSIVGDEERPAQRAALIERYLVSNFRYVPNSVPVRNPMTIEEFLLRERGGHCEYFAAGMTVLLTALDVPARVVGGYYGGRLNPITGYYTLRRSDAHAWTEVWDGTRWATFDSTPPSLRPGTQPVNLLREYLATLTDSMTFIWDRYVLTFGLADQVALLSDLIVWTRESIATLRERASLGYRAFASRSFGTIAAALAALGLGTILIVRRRRPLFHALAEVLAQHGVELNDAMTMDEALERLRREKPEVADTLTPLIAMYEEERFSSRSDAGRAADIRRRLAELRA
jgi:protein-glutamine gamma-glutamyltransferase